MERKVLFNDSKKDKKIVKDGYSFSTLFLNFLVPLYRKDLLGFLIIFSYDLLSLLFWKGLNQGYFLAIGILFFPMVYNKFYIWSLVDKGYIIESDIKLDSEKLHAVA